MNEIYKREIKELFDEYDRLSPLTNDYIKRVIKKQAEDLNIENLENLDEISKACCNNFKNNIDMLKDIYNNVWEFTLNNEEELIYYMSLIRDILNMLKQ